MIVAAVRMRVDIWSPSGENIKPGGRIAEAPKRTLTLAIVYMQGFYTAEYPLIRGGAVLGAAPIMIVFAFSRRVDGVEPHEAHGSQVMDHQADLPPTPRLEVARHDVRHVPEVARNREDPLPCRGVDVAPVA